MEVGRSTLNSLEVEIQRLDITLELNAWERIVPRCKGVQITAGGNIQNQSRVADSWIFLSEGVAASEQTDHDGASTIARFFEPGDFCANASASIRCSLNRQFSNECCVPHLGHPNHSPLKHPSKSMERQERGHDAAIAPTAAVSPKYLSLRLTRISVMRRQWTLQSGQDAPIFVHCESAANFGTPYLMRR